MKYVDLELGETLEILLKTLTGVKSMMRMILLYIMLLGTACSNSHVYILSNDFLSPTETVNSANAVAPNNVDNEKSKTKSDNINSKAKDVTLLIPEGWHILEKEEPVKAEGDLNKDGIKDIAIVIEKTQESNERSLLIAFGNEDHTYSLSIIADNVVLGAFEGGGWGDPFDDLIIDRGSVVVSDFGGGITRWYHKYRFSFQDNDWYLIGATVGENHLIKESTEMGNDEDDYNLLTGDFISTRTNENGEVKTTKGNRGKRKLIKLREFDIDQMYNEIFIGLRKEVERIV